VSCSSKTKKPRGTSVKFLTWNIT